MSEAKPFCISKWEVWEAYKRVKANKGAAGVDEQTIGTQRASRQEEIRVWLGENTATNCWITTGRKGEGVCLSCPVRPESPEGGSFERNGVLRQKRRAHPGGVGSWTTHGVPQSHAHGMPILRRSQENCESCDAAFRGREVARSPGLLKPVLP